jgi:hypothetical protein
VVNVGHNGEVSDFIAWCHKGHIAALTRRA